MPFRYHDLPELEILTKPFTFVDPRPKVEKVIYNDPATIVIWRDGTKTVVKCQPGDTYDEEKGLLMCICKKYFGNTGNFNEVLKKWVPEKESDNVDDRSISPVKAGTRIRIIDAGCGAWGANGKIGVVMLDHKGNKHGLTDHDLGYFVRTDNNGIWKIAINAKIEIIE